MILRLPAELQRKIITRLPASKLKIAHHTCKELKELELTKLLTGWYLECLVGIDNYISYKRRKLYNDMNKKKGFLFCIYEMLESINKMVGDYTHWDAYDTLRRDYKYILTRTLLRGINNNMVVMPNVNNHTNSTLFDDVYDTALDKNLEKKILRMNNIKRFRYIKEILKSTTLRALI